MGTLRRAAHSALRAKKIKSGLFFLANTFIPQNSVKPVIFSSNIREVNLPPADLSNPFKREYFKYLSLSMTMLFSLLLSTVNAAPSSDHWEVEFYGGHFPVPGSSDPDDNVSSDPYGDLGGTPVLYGTGITSDSLTYRFDDRDIQDESSDPAENPWNILAATLASSTPNPTTGPYPDTNDSGSYTYVYKRTAPYGGAIKIGSEGDYFDDFAELFINGTLVDSIDKFTEELEASDVILESVNAGDEIEMRFTNGASLGGFDYSAVFTPDSDYGDAPASFGTPKHKVNNQLSIGATVDAEFSAAHSSDGSGDNSADTNDEDGVTLASLYQGEAVTIPVAVTGAGYLQAWFDWAGDGTFLGAGDQVAFDVQDGGIGDADGLANGIISLSLKVPTNAMTTSDIFYRLRWSTTQGLDSISNAPDGEVEDYSVTVSSPPLCSNNLVEDEFDGTFGTTNTYRDLDSPVTGYNYSPGTEGGWYPGSYTILSAGIGVADWHPLAVTTSGATTGSADDAFLMVNGSTVSGIFFQKAINVTPGISLEVGVSARNWARPAFDSQNERPNIAMLIYASDGVTLLGQSSTGSIAGADGWITSSETISTGLNSQIIVRLKNLSVQSVGNDFAIDNLSIKAFGRVCTFDNYDYGDAPDSYGTSKASDGAVHTISDDIYLGGSKPDGDSDGAPSVGADSDDVDADDEDAVTRGYTEEPPKVTILR